VSDSLHPVLTGEFVYRLSVPHAGSGVNQADLSNSDIYALDDTHLLVDEHDNVTDVAGAGEKRVYAIDLAGATNIAGTADDGESPALESAGAAGITPAAKTLWLSLEDFGYDHDKPEGIGLFPNGDLAVQDDNDFGFNQGNDPGTLGPNDPPFKVTPSTKSTQLWRFKPTNIGSGTVGGSVPAALALTLGAPASFDTFTAGIANDYSAATTATVVSTAGDATLSVSDPGHLANGSFSLPDPLQVTLSRSSWAAPVSNDVVDVAFKQHINANDALRTGSYSKTLTFTLSTTTP
jgi:hypothetical protein